MCMYPVSQLEASISGRKAALLKEGFDNCEEEDVKNLVKKVAAQLHHVRVSVTEASVPLHQESAKYILFLH